MRAVCVNAYCICECILNVDAHMLSFPGSRCIVLICRRIHSMGLTCRCSCSCTSLCARMSWPCTSSMLPPRIRKGIEPLADLFDLWLWDVTAALMGKRVEPHWRGRVQHLSTTLFSVPARHSWRDHVQQASSELSVRKNYGTCLLYTSPSPRDS